MSADRRHTGETARLRASIRCVVTIPAHRTKATNVATATMGSFLGKDGVFETIADDMILASGGAPPIDIPRRGFAIFGEIGLEEIALCFRLALERAVLDVLLALVEALLLDESRLALSASTRAVEMRASFSRERMIFSASARIWRSRSAICALSSLMRGCPSRSVEDCSASWARNVTRCSDSRRISSEFITSAASIGSPRRNMSRMMRARVSASAFCAARRIELGTDFTDLLAAQGRVVGAEQEIGVGRNSSAFVSASATLWRNFSISPASHSPAPRVAPGGYLLAAQIIVGDCIGDARCQNRIGGLELDDDDAGLVDRIGRQPVVPRLRAHAPPATSPGGRAKSPLRRATGAASRRAKHRIEFRQFIELQFADDVERKLARQDDLDLIGERSPASAGPRSWLCRLLGIRDAGTRSRGRRRRYAPRTCSAASSKLTRRRRRSRGKGRPDDPMFPAPQRSPSDRRSRSLARSRTPRPLTSPCAHCSTPDLLALETIMVAGGLISGATGRRAVHASASRSAALLRC